MSEGLTRDHTPEELCELIRKISKHFQTSMIIVDGLDEITNNRADVTRLLRSLNTENGQVKTLFASRPEVDIGYELEDFVQIPIAAMSTDLRLYVASGIERRTRERKLRIRDPSLKDHIMKTLVDGADGMYVPEFFSWRWLNSDIDQVPVGGMPNGLSVRVQHRSGPSGGLEEVTARLTELIRADP